MLEGPDLTTMYIIERLNIKEKSELLYDASMYWFDVSIPIILINDYVINSNIHSELELISLYFLSGLSNELSVSILECLSKHFRNVCHFHEKFTEHDR